MTNHYPRARPIGERRSAYPKTLAKIRELVALGWNDRQIAEHPEVRKTVSAVKHQRHYHGIPSAVGPGNRSGAGNRKAVP